jgi:hypothetical protein
LPKKTSVAGGYNGRMFRRGVGLVAIAALAAGGCLIVPETRMHELRRYTHESDVKPSAAEPVVLARPEGPELRVEAQWRRTCTVWRSEIAEYRVEKTATLADLDGMGGCSGEGCGYALIGILVLAPLTLTVSGIITGIIVSKSHDETRREVKSQAPDTYDCGAPGAGFQVRVSVHGQPDVAALTDAEGHARILLPSPTPASVAHPIVLHTDSPRGVAPVVIRRGPPGAR